MIRIAVSQYTLELLPNWNTYAAKIENWVKQACEKKVQLLLFPEYAGTEIACRQYDTDPELFAAIQQYIPLYLELYCNLSKRYQIYIQSGTVPIQISNGHYANRAYFFSPKGAYGYQDKLQQVEYEKQLQVLADGTQQTLFETALGKIGITVCYDSEFPELVRNLVKAGAWLILVPSYTSSLRGYHRVFYSCRARAIENQCYLATSYVCGLQNLSSEIEEVVGQAHVLCPIDEGFPEDGIVAQGIIDQTDLIIADLDPQKLEFIRQNGQVHNWEDSHSYKTALPIQTVSLKLYS